MLRGIMPKVLGLTGPSLVTVACVSWLIAGCSDLDKAIEDQANEVLGKKTQEPEAKPAADAPPTEPSGAPTTVPAQPEPQAPPPEEPTAAAPVEPPAAVQAPKPAPAKPLEIAKPIAKTEEPPKPKPVAQPTAPAPKPVEAAKPEPAKPVEIAKPVEPPKPKSKVAIPQSKRIKVSVTSRMQELLDADTRMQPWLNSTMGTIEACYADVLKSSASASGTITFVLTMHKDARPDADITNLPPALSGVVACATGKLMRAARMPLFTGPENEKQTVRVKLAP